MPFTFFSSAPIQASQATSNHPSTLFPRADISIKDILILRHKVEYGSFFGNPFASFPRQISWFILLKIISISIHEQTGESLLTIEDGLEGDNFLWRYLRLYGVPREARPFLRWD